MYDLSRWNSVDLCILEKVQLDKVFRSERYHHGAIESGTTHRAEQRRPLPGLLCTEPLARATVCGNAHGNTRQESSLNLQAPSRTSGQVRGAGLASSGAVPKAAGPSSSKPVETELLTVEGLIFRPGQLVRLELMDSEVAADEGRFAQVLGQFLDKARAGKKQVVEEADSLQVWHCFRKCPCFVILVSKVERRGR